MRGSDEFAIAVRIRDNAPDRCAAIDRENMIDADGFRPNVGIVLAREDGRVFWARRAGQDGWQFPQGGMRSDETPLEAMYRELAEETGLGPEHVEVLGSTPGWLRYRLPRRLRRRHQRPVCIGQKQVWFLLNFLADDSAVRLDHTDEPEFDGFRWVDFWYPVEHVIFFKRRVYKRALRQLEPLVPAFQDRYQKPTGNQGRP